MNSSYVNRLKQPFPEQAQPPWRRDNTPHSSRLVQEQAGMHVSISSDLPEAAAHAVTVLGEKYEAWLERGRYAAWGQYKRDYFTIAVGGGNTLKAQYRAMVEQLAHQVDWVQRVRFFVLEESAGEDKRESPGASLIENFIQPLQHKLLSEGGRRKLLKGLGLGGGASENQILEAMKQRMINGLHMSAVRGAIAAGNRRNALQLARNEAARYQRDIQRKIGASMEFHYLISGIGKKGDLGAFSPYMPELAEREPGALVLRPAPGALRIALNRGVLVNAECLSLIVAGSLKLQALGRFEMEEVTDFEQTVMETPLRMLRESSEIAEKVYVFSDEQALHFDVTEFGYIEDGQQMSVKAETREGEERGAPHILLLHGFMGLFSFTNLLVRLPSAWTVSALHRGSHAKTLDNDSIFPHYAHGVREAILDLSRKGQKVPIAGHSIAGCIFDHLLLTLLDDYEAPIKPYAELASEDRELVDALRAGGMIHLATWAPADGPHAGRNIANLKANLKDNETLDYSGLDAFYVSDNGDLTTTEEATVTEKDGLQGLDRFLATPLAKPIINAVNVVLRSLLNLRSVQQGMLNTDSPYVMRLVGNRLLKTASFYGLCKEVNAAMHDPEQYQQRHLKALQIVAAYNIPHLSLLHEDDFLVSARRHEEEYRYLLKLKRKYARKTGEAPTTTRYVALTRDSEELPRDPLNPHLLIMSTSSEGNRLARQITGEITRFVEENMRDGRKQVKTKVA